MNNEPAFIVLKGLEGNEPTHLVGLQPLLLSHADSLAIGWWLIFFTTFAYLLVGKFLWPIVRRYSRTTE
ncbi:MAG TPA: hypothetical protein VNM40_01715 [Candidatus Paceibacterota bacterium]|nr:hypothetical protein [Candidatus Paceibacterota bacterium]